MNLKEQAIKVPSNKFNPPRAQKSNGEGESENNLVIMRFSNLPDLHIGNAFIQIGGMIKRPILTKQGRILEEEEVVEEETNIVNNEENNEEFNIPLSAANFAGYVISIALVLAIYHIYTILDGIKTPQKYYDKQFYLGKEY